MVAGLGLLWSAHAISKVFGRFWLTLHGRSSLSCMPQLNPTTLGLAVSDLSEVAALATYFVVVAPPTTHCNTGEPSNMKSYQSRGWCDRSLGVAAALGSVAAAHHQVSA